VSISISAPSFIDCNNAPSEVDKDFIIDIRDHQCTTSLLRFLSDTKAVEVEMDNGGKWHTHEEMMQRLSIAQ
jgi:hypothetical protein